MSRRCMFICNCTSKRASSSVCVCVATFDCIKHCYNCRLRQMRWNKKIQAEHSCKKKQQQINRFGVANFKLAHIQIAKTKRQTMTTTTTTTTIKCISVAIAFFIVDFDERAPYRKIWCKCECDAKVNNLNLFFSRHKIDNNSKY